MIFAFIIDMFSRGDRFCFSEDDDLHLLREAGVCKAPDSIDLQSPVLLEGASRQKIGKDLMSQAPQERSKSKSEDYGDLQSSDEDVPLTNLKFKSEDGVDACDEIDAEMVIGESGPKAIDTSDDEEEFQGIELTGEVEAKDPMRDHRKQFRVFHPLVNLKSLSHRSDYVFAFVQLN